MRVLTADGAEPFGMGGGAATVLGGGAAGFKFIIWATTL